MLNRHILKRQELIWRFTRTDGAQVAAAAAAFPEISTEYPGISHPRLVHFESRKDFADDNLRALLGASLNEDADCPLSKPPTIIYSSIPNLSGLLSF
ncbi:MAG: hypothetical protein WCK15_19210 [Pirellula sp.]